jgi:hypothetical protein
MDHSEKAPRRRSKGQLSKSRQRAHAGRRRWAPLIAGVIAFVAAGALVWVSLPTGGSKDGGFPGPYLGTDAVAGVEVLTPSVDLGRLPLDQPVSHTFVVTNTNDRVIELGKLRIEVLDGC